MRLVELVNKRSLIRSLFRSARIATENRRLKTRYIEDTKKD